MLSYELKLLFSSSELVLGPPINIEIRHAGGGAFIIWEPPQPSDGLLGYKLNWGPVGSSIPQIALGSTGVKDPQFFLPAGVFAQNGETTSVLLWAYTLSSDGEAITIDVSALPCKTN